MPSIASVVGESGKRVQVVSCHVLTAILLVRMLGSATTPYSGMEVGKTLTTFGYGITGGNHGEIYVLPGSSIQD